MCVGGEEGGRMSDARHVFFRDPTVIVGPTTLTIRKNPRHDHSCEVGCDVTELVFRREHITSSAYGARSVMTDYGNAGHLTVACGPWLAVANLLSVGVDWCDVAALEAARNDANERAIALHMQISALIAGQSVSHLDRPVY
jgi:hypothetical protein